MGNLAEAQLLEIEEVQKGLSVLMKRIIGGGLEGEMLDNEARNMFLYNEMAKTKLQGVAMSVKVADVLYGLDTPVSAPAAKIANPSGRKPLLSFPKAAEG